MVRGIDSTAVLVSLLMHFPHSQIKIIMSLDSVNEYPEFYTQHILNKTKEPSLREPQFVSFYIPEEGIARSIDTDWNYYY